MDMPIQQKLEIIMQFSEFLEPEEIDVDGGGRAIEMLREGKQIEMEKIDAMLERIQEIHEQLQEQMKNDVYIHEFLEFVQHPRAWQILDDHLEVDEEKLPEGISRKEMVEDMMGELKTVALGLKKQFYTQAYEESICPDYAPAVISQFQPGMEVEYIDGAQLGTAIHQSIIKFLEEGDFQEEDEGDFDLDLVKTLDFFETGQGLEALKSASESMEKAPNDEFLEELEEEIVAYLQPVINKMKEENIEPNEFNFRDFIWALDLGQEFYTPEELAQVVKDGMGYS